MFNGNFYKSMIFISLWMGFSNCYDLKREKLETYNRYRTQKIDYRDSLYILFTVKAWHDSDGIPGASGYRNYSRLYKMSNSEVTYFFGGVFYNTDKKRIIVWLGEKLPNAKTNVIYNKDDISVNKLCPQGKDTIYDMAAVIGFRDDTNEMWKLYPLEIFSAECYDSKEAVISVTGQYYFEAMKASCPEWVNRKNIDSIKFGGKLRWDLEKQRADMGLADKKGDSISGLEYDILEDFGYNLQEKDFWDKSLLWEKGARVKGYYLFQLNGNGGTAIDPLKLPKIIYPDRISKLFK
jgi:hypothetical protein